MLTLANLRDSILTTENTATLFTNVLLKCCTSSLGIKLLNLVIPNADTLGEFTLLGCTRDR
ncbi:hypothetical protein GOODEAATRI_028983, partial [Goodea atripinnis]